MYNLFPRKRDGSSLLSVKQQNTQDISLFSKRFQLECKFSVDYIIDINGFYRLSAFKAFYTLEHVLDLVYIRTSVIRHL